jgi:hypothetical protein
MHYVHHYDKRSGITYVYESVSYRDKETKKPRSKRTLIGRIDPLTGEIVPTDGRGKRRGEGKNVDLSTFKRKNIGATWLLDAIGEDLGLIDDLKYCFPHSYEKILSLAYYMVLDNSTVMSGFRKWEVFHKHPFGKDIPSQRSSELFASIGESEKKEFFRRLVLRQNENEYWIFDLTSLSSYSELLPFVKYGYNRENDPLPQLNLALVVGEKSGLPFYFRRLAGNIPDVSTLKEQLASFDELGLSKIKLVMDKGFYSTENVNELYRMNYKFLMSTKASNKHIRSAFDSIYNDLKSPKTYSSIYEMHMTTVRTQWVQTETRPRKGDRVSKSHRMYIHCYYCPKKAAALIAKLNIKVSNMIQELESGNRNPKKEKLYAKWFDEKKFVAR